MVGKKHSVPADRCKTDREGAPLPENPRNVNKSKDWEGSPAEFSEEGDHHRKRVSTIEETSQENSSPGGAGANRDLIAVRNLV